MLALNRSWMPMGRLDERQTCGINAPPQAHSIKILSAARRSLPTAWRRYLHEHNDDT
jgi:hypothetical protein